MLKYGNVWYPAYRGILGTKLGIWVGVMEFWWIVMTVGSVMRCRMRSHLHITFCPLSLVRLHCLLRFLSTSVPRLLDNFDWCERLHEDFPHQWPCLRARDGRSLNGRCCSSWSPRCTEWDVTASPTTKKQAKSILLKNTIMSQKFWEPTWFREAYCCQVPASTKNFQAVSEICCACLSRLLVKSVGVRGEILTSHVLTERNFSYERKFPLEKSLLDFEVMKICKFCKF